MTNANHLFRSRNGSDHFFQHRPSRIYFSQGVKDLADICSAYWLLELIISYQCKRRIKAEGFQVWELKRINEDRFIVTATDGNHHRLVYHYLPQCDFTYDLATIWLIRGVLVLPVEY
ncbi:hypothetical protein OCK74_14960 [Chitinophagaceae bacterium LB-8]|uniref:DUF6876 domain-containing protein n=1 Tax=Paraflavisolibacter caeni TaxID=2982496 RepID=A0A9X3BG75_9BACT|nr:DUF6876 family protein [Paraflavisolibacter caeni]MCU7550419.1 hypothetical protein [Paraflavisolibacter caeni]